jgi:hypothetical protein
MISNSYTVFNPNMTKKRGRPFAANSEDTALLRRRQLTAERTRRYRQQRAARRDTVTHGQTLQQLQQAEQIAEHTFQEVEAAQTLQSLRLRI